MDPQIPVELIKAIAEQDQNPVKSSKKIWCKKILPIIKLNLILFNLGVQL